FLVGRKYIRSKVTAERIVKPVVPLEQIGGKVHVFYHGGASEFLATMAQVKLRDRSAPMKFCGVRLVHSLGSRRKISIVRREHSDADRPLPHVTLTDGKLSLLFRFTERRQKQRCENRDHRDHDEQLDQRERLAPPVTFTRAVHLNISLCGWL